MAEIYCHHYLTEGLFNLCGTEKETQCVLTVKGIDGSDQIFSVSELWPLGGCPVRSDMLPSEVVNQISERLESYWISSDRDMKRVKLERLREHSKAIDASWLRARIATKERELRDLRYQLQDIEEAA